MNILEWNVFIDNHNTKRIEMFNVFSHYGFLKDCFYAYSKTNDFNEFKAFIKQSLMYYFWSKFEYETLITDLLDKNIKKKIDVFEQVMLNYDIFISKLYENMKYIVGVKGWNFEEYTDFAEQRV